MFSEHFSPIFAIRKKKPDGPSYRDAWTHLKITHQLDEPEARHSSQGMTDGFLL